MILCKLKYWLFLFPLLLLSGMLTAQCVNVTVVGNTAFVTSNANSGAGSLRAAILCLNAPLSGVTNINFSVPGAGDVIISPNLVFPLPAITKNNAVIDARTQPGWTLGKVIIDGSNANSHGLSISANNCSVYGLFIRNFTTAATGAGIHLASGTNNLVEENALSGNRIGLFANSGSISFTATNNSIGINPGNGAAMGNNSQGIFIINSSSGDYIVSNNTIAFNSVGVYTASPLVNALITQNSMYCNALGGIDRGGFSVTPFSINAASTLQVSGQGPSGAVIELFISDESSCATNVPCQGTTFLGSATIPGASNDWSINVSGSVSSTDEVTITATVGGNNTTEFANCSALTCPAITTVFNNINNTCAGSTQGSATAVPSGGTSPYTFLWSDGQLNATATNLAVGTYNVTVTDNAGCTGTGVVTIGANPSPTTNPDSNSPICEGDNLELMANATFLGLGSLTYSWEGPDSFTSNEANPIISGADLNAAGSYSVTVTASNGCVDRAMTDVTVNAAPIIMLTPTDAACNGEASGSVSLSVNGNPNDFNYSWSNSANTQNISNLLAGNYMVTVTNQNTLCQNTASTTVAEPSLLSLQFNATDPTCGASNGSLQAIPGGGTPNYTFAWSNGQMNATAVNLQAGTYEVTVTDMNGCMISDQASISDQGGPLLSPDITHLLCNGDASGSINLNITGGTPPIDINWNNGSSTEVINNLSAGTYDVTVIDGNNCQSNASLMVDQPTALDASIDTTPTACSSSTGTATATINGGSPNYNISWDNGASGLAANNLSAGNHTVTITDAQNCQLIEPFVITTADAPSAAIQTVTDVLCNGEATGSITLGVNGGLPPYQYSWSNGSSDPSLVNVPAANYEVTISDQNGCATILNATINEPLLPLVLTPTSTDATCGQSDGTASIAIEGGTAPYTASWSNGMSGTTISGLNSGIYEVTVTDDNNCTENAILGISDEGGPELGTLISNITCNGNNDGSIILSIMEGTPPYSINWSNGAMIQTLENLEAGDYSVTVEDDNQCQATVAATVFEPDSLQIQLSISALDCNGNNSTISVTVNGGTPDYTYLWSNGDNTATLTDVGPGTYSLSVTDDVNCTTSQSIEIPELVELLILNTTPVSMPGSEDGTVTFEIQGGSPSFDYNFSGPENGSGTLPIAGSETLGDLLPGTYTLEINDNNGCSQTINFIIGNAGCDLTIDSVQVVNESCLGASDGQIQVFTSLGTDPLSYNWNGSPGFGNGIGTQINGLTAGEYQISITDANSCVDTITVSLETENNLSAPDSTTVTACTQADGSGLFDLTAVEGAINSNNQANVNWYEDAMGNQVIANPASFSSTGGSVYATLNQDGCESAATEIPLILLPPNDPGCLTGGNCDTFGVLNFIQGLDSLCQGQPLELSTNDLGAPGIRYFWIHPNGDTTITTDPTYEIPAVDPSDEGEYFVYAQAENCFFDETGPFILIVEGLRDGEVIMASEDAVVCDPQVALTAMPVSSATAFWSSPTGNQIANPSATSINVNDLQPGENLFVWNVTTTGCGSIGSDTVRVILEISPFANDDFFTLQRANTEIFMDILKNDNITPNQPVDFFAISQPAFGELIKEENGFQYFEKEGRRGIVFFDYVVCNPNSACANACDTARVTIDVLNLPSIPEGISPNGDGINDELVVIGIFENDPDVYMDITITNRWGDIVFKSADYTRATPWDGKFQKNGKPLPQGAYYCVIETQVGDAIYEDTQTVYIVR